MFTQTKVNVALLFLQTLNTLECLKKTLIGGFTLVNTRLAFDTDILLNDNNERKVLFDIDIEGKTNKKSIV